MKKKHSSRANKCIARYALLCISLFGVLHVVAQETKPIINGRVVDVHNEPISGVTVLEQGTTNGVATDMDGNFNLKVSIGTTLQISFISYKTETVKVENTKVMKIVLHEDVQELEAVVVVGYGTQKKVNLSGAVDQVTGEIFENRAIANATQGLQGQIPNLNIKLLDGKPSQAPAYNVRGITSIGQGGNALVLIDGVEGNPALLNPNDIESVSVLKDAASASIYGARGAFGVVLISTKTPQKGRFQVNYSTNQSIKKPVAVPENITDGYLWAQNFSDAYDAWNDYTSLPTKINKTQPFSPEYLAELKKRHDDPSLSKYGIDPITKENIYYGSTDWYDLLYKDNLYAQDQNISVSGSNDRISYFLSGRFTQQNGLFKYNSDDYSMYNLRSKASMKITKWLNVSNNTEFSTMEYHNPVNVGEGGSIWRNIADEGHPTSMMFNEDGTLTHSSAYTVGDFWYDKSGRDTHQDVFKNTTALDVNIIKDQLIFTTNFTVQQTNEDIIQKRIPVPYSRTNGVISYQGTNTNDLQENNSKTLYLATNAYATYHHRFNNVHDLKILGGLNYEESTYKRLFVQRNGILYPDAEDFNLTFGDAYQINGGYNKWRIMGLFYRANYSFKDRYLIELNARYDGSSKFNIGDQYQLFPSASFAWRMSEEKFFAIDPNLISNLKFRVSYGSLGNGNITPYQFAQSYKTQKLNRIIAGGNPVYFSAPDELPESLTWETSTTTNFGFDLEIWENKLTVTGDVYRRNTTGMYTSALTPPNVYGGNTPKGNYADLKTDGWELAINYKNQFNLAHKPFVFNVGIGLSDNTSTITKFNNPTKLLGNHYEGEVLGEIWGYTTMGLFQSQDEIDNAPSQSYIMASNSKTNLPGDIRFADLNHSGAIDDGNRTVDNPGDKSIIGNSTPHYRYTINLGSDWNNIFFSCMFTGVLKQDWWPGAESRFWGQYNRPYNQYPAWQQGNVWSEDNPNAYLPRLRGYSALSGNSELGVPQTRYLQNAAYIKLQNIQLGYNLPKTLANKISAQNVKVYLSGENLWSWSPMYKYTRDTYVENIYGSDPDLTSGDSGNGYNYPMLSSFTMGLSITF